MVRIAFLDEAGRSCLEPIIVVAGPIVHGDRTYRQLVQRLHEITEQYLPAADRKGFVFHAKDVFHGAGRYFRDRELWPKERRWTILRALADLPREFGLPITFGSLDKAEIRQATASPLSPNASAKLRGRFIDAIEHVIAFAWAEIGIDLQMQRFPRDEICMVIAEDTDRVKPVVKLAHSILRDPDEIAANPVFARMPGLPLRKVEDTPHFAAKADSAPLQVADTCAFLILRRLLRREESQPFFEAIAPQLVWSPQIAGQPVFGKPMGAEQIATGSRY